MKTILQLEEKIRQNENSSEVLEDVANILKVAISLPKSYFQRGEFAGEAHSCSWHSKHYGTMLKLGLAKEYVGNPESRLEKPLSIITPLGEHIYEKLVEEGYYKSLKQE